MIEYILELIITLPDEIKVFILSMIPIFECRGSIPVAILSYGMNPLKSYIISIIGNIFPIPIIYKGLDISKKELNKLKLFRKISNNASNKINKVKMKYKKWGITVFTAIPLPYTGAWTATLGSDIIGLDLKETFKFIAVGVSIAGIIVTLIASSLGSMI